MPSTRLTKINIDVDMYELIKTLAIANNLSATKMLEKIILAYIAKNK